MNETPAGDCAGRCFFIVLKSRLFVIRGVDCRPLGALGMPITMGLD